MSPQETKSLRQKLGLAQGEFAKLLGVSASAVRTWELGRLAPGASSREALAKIKAMTQEQVDAALGPASPAMTPQQIKGLRQNLGLARAMCKSPSLNRIPILMLAEVNQELGLKVSTYDIDNSWLPIADFLEKPVNFGMLASKVTSMLQAAGSRPNRTS